MFKEVLLTYTQSVISCLFSNRIDVRRLPFPGPRRHHTPSPPNNDGHPHLHHKNTRRHPHHPPAPGSHPPRPPHHHTK